MARIGFHVRNGFQVSHFRPLFRATPDAKWIVKTNTKAQAFGIGADEPVVTSRLFMRRAMERQFDIVVSQSSPPGKSRLTRAKFVMLQYGYAKEPYNFGPWRAAADLILAYGDYAEKRFGERARSVAIGNPRWDDWTDPAFRQAAVARFSKDLSPGLKTLVYAPTWGDLSSAPDWLDKIESLAGEYNVLIKAHHNATRDGQMGEPRQQPNLHYLPDADLFALLAVSDVMISDLSGAIFDAVLCEKPVVLVSPNDLAARLGKKLDADSLEIANRAAFGTIVETSTDLAPAVATAVQNGPTVTKDWVQALFRTDGQVADHFHAALKTLQNG